MGTVYLDNRILTTPPMAVRQVERECERLSSLARKSYDMVIKGFFDRDLSYAEKVEKNEKVIDYLTHEITRYIVKINGLDIVDEDRKIMGNVQLFRILKESVTMPKILLNVQRE